MKHAQATVPHHGETLDLVRESRTVRYGGAQVQLADLSFRLLALLADSAPHAVPYDRIAGVVWNAHVTRETLKQRIKLLRDELRELGVPDTAIEAIRNTGYRLTIATGPAETAASNARPRSRIVAMLAAAILACGAMLMVWMEDRSGTAGDRPLTIAVAAIPAGDTAGDTALGTAVRNGLMRTLSRLEDVAIVDVAQAGRPGRSDLLVTIALPAPDGQQRIDIALVEKPTGTLLWAETYEPGRIEASVLHAANNIHAFAITLGASLGNGGYRAQPDSTRRAYLKALRWWRSGDESRLLAAQASLLRLQDGNPGFRLARSLLARVEADLVIRHGRPRRLVEDDAIAMASLLQQHGNIADFHFSMARVRLAQGNKAGALAELRRAAPAMPFLVRDIAALEREMAGGT